MASSGRNITVSAMQGPGLSRRDPSMKAKLHLSTRDVFYVRREVDLMKTAKVKAYIMHIFGKIELLSIHATLNYFKIHYFNAL